MTQAVHLLDDFALGGVTKSLAMFERPEFATCVKSRTLPINPKRALAPKLDADIIFTHFPPSWASLPFLTALRWRNPRAKLVHVEHSYSRSWEALKVAHRGRFHAMLRLTLSVFDRVVAVSDGQMRWLKEAVPALPTHQVIHPWSGDQGLADVSPVSGGTSSPLVVGAYGRFAEQKGFDTLIDAVRLLDPARFRLLLGGFGPDEGALRERADGAANIEFFGKFTNPSEFLTRTDLIAVPSRWEPFGQVAAEAKLAGRALIVADVDGLPEQVIEGAIVDCSSSEGLAAAFEQVDRPKLAAMGAVNREAMRDANTRHRQAWHNLFDQLSSPSA